MKKLILSCVVMLSGCALMIGPYDPNEYLLVTQIRTLAETTNCANPLNTANNVEMMYNDAATLKNYSQYLPDNEAEIKLTADLYKLVDEFHNKQSPAEFYCKAKLNIIAKSAERIQQVTGSKPR